MFLLMPSFREKYPLPGQLDPHLTPCAFCRRRLVVNGRPVFTTCSCKELGPPVTIRGLAAGVALLAGGLWWLARRQR